MEHVYTMHAPRTGKYLGLVMALDDAGAMDAAKQVTGRKVVAVEHLTSLRMYKEMESLQKRYPLRAA